MKLKTKNISGSNQEHALLSPSAAKKWLGCPAALACEFGIPNESGQAAVLGTAMHTISEIHLNRYIDGTARALEADEGCYVMDNGKGGIVAKAKAPKDGVLITKDMIDQCRKYTDYCKPIIDAADYVKLEMRAELTQILHPGYIAGDEDGNLVESVQTFGTADLVAVMPRADGGHMLIIGDLKTGRHRVEAKENKQLMLYALGVMRRLRRKYDITLVRLVIFQPYAGGESEWDITPEALAHFGKFAAARAVMALDAFYKGKKNLKIADFKPSADACQWCRFAEKCTARAKAAVQIGGGQVASDSDLSDTESTEMTPEQLKAAYDKLPELRQHIATIEKAVYSALHKGVKVPGLKLVEGRPGNRTWTDADAIEVSHGDVLKKEVLMSPTEAAKVLSAAEMAELEPFITRKPGQPSVASEDDKREEWKAASDVDLA
ncbi:PD-(D/E)XK nuclease superfamily protein [Serratia phage Tsm2]|uniref:PD-(D/E)XK nuclease superfamily protein n=1 Tax=Serratia phage Tsm2 TaxID=2787014 RepID=A0A7S9SP03_9CAUD|nr:PD-(D/E)XK nuclease superfamily protein [Serratia phage Tsm2]QPI13701.1 PD-(D/E)XK nuclease superfamily protein [Serratia phage Tsm2]